jgi:hypothetical protein
MFGIWHKMQPVRRVTLELALESTIMDITSRVGFCFCCKFCL